MIAHRFLPEDDPPLGKRFEHLFDLTIFGHVRFMKARPGMRTKLVSFGCCGVHTEGTRAQMPGSVTRSCRFQPDGLNLVTNARATFALAPIDRI